MTKEKQTVSVSVIFICLGEGNLQKAIRKAEILGMTGPDYVYLYYQLLPSAFTHRPWSGERAAAGAVATGREVLPPEDVPEPRAFRSMKQVS